MQNQSPILINPSFNFGLLSIFSFWLQGIPSCPVSVDVLRSYLPDLGCWNLSADKEGGGIEDTPAAANNNNNHIIIGDLGSGGNQKDHFGPNLTPLHRFYKQQQQRKMPGFRGRRGLCGCFQVSTVFIFFFVSFDFAMTRKFSIFLLYLLAAGIARRHSNP